MMYHAFLLGVALSPLFRAPATRTPAIVAIAPPPSADQDGARGAAERTVAAGAWGAPTTAPPPKKPPRKAPSTRAVAKKAKGKSSRVARVTYALRALPDGATVEEVGAALGGLELSPQAYTSVLSELRKMRRWRLALALGEWLDSAGDDGLPNLVHYNAMLSACAAAGQHGPAQDLLSQMETRGIAPDQQSYATAVSACERAGAWRDALALLDALEEAAPPAAVRPTPQPRTPPTADGDAAPAPAEAAAEATPAAASPRGAGVGLAMAYTAAMWASGRAGETDVALGILDRMRERGVAADAHAYSAALGACRKGGRWQRACDLLGEMREIDGVEPNGYSYSLAIGACSRAGQSEAALGLFEERKALDEPLDAYSCVAALEACAASKQSSRAVALLEEMETSRDASLTANTFAWNAAMLACSRAGEWAEAIALYGKMGEYSSRRVESPAPPRRRPAAAAVEAEAAGPAPVAARSEHSVATAVDAARQLGDHAMAAELYEKSGCRTTMATNAYLGALVAAADWAGVVRTYEAMGSGGAGAGAADEQSKLHAIEAYGKTDPERALELFEEIGGGGE